MHARGVGALSGVSSYKDTNDTNLGLASQPYDVLNLNYLHKGPFSTDRHTAGWDFSI